MEKTNENLNEQKDWFESDLIFNSLYSGYVQQAAQKHWTPLAVAKEAAEFLAIAQGSKVLDIGSGAGKFCLTAARYHPGVQFFGVEQRAELVLLCQKIQSDLKLKNISFINKNITEVDFADYDHFYFYNSFYENIEGTQKIDYTVPYSEKLYDYYNLYVYKQFKKLPSGTRVATFHSFGNEMPNGYEVVHSAREGYLKFWIKL